MMKDGFRMITSEISFALMAAGSNPNFGESQF